MNELLHKFKLGNDAELLLEKRGGGYEKVATVPIGSQALGATTSSGRIVSDGKFIPALNFGGVPVVAVGDSITAQGQVNGIAAAWDTANGLDTPIALQGTQELCPTGTGSGGTGVGSLAWSASAKTLTWTPNGLSAGAPVSIPRSGIYIIPGPGLRQGIRVGVKANLLPTSDVTGTVTSSGSPAVGGTYHGHAPWAQTLSLGRMRILGNYGIQGARTDHCTDYIKQALEENTSAAEALILIGTNDLGVLTTAQSLANITAVAKTCTDAGVLPRFVTVLPRNSLDAGRSAQLHAINRLLVSMASDRGAKVVDAYGALANPLDGTLIAGVSADGLHPNALGAYIVGKAIAQSYLADYPGPARYWAGADDTYNATTGLGNLVAAIGSQYGSGGTLTTATGVCTTGMSLKRTLGSALACVGAKVARTDASGEWQRMSFSGAAAEEAYQQQSGSITVNPGEKWQAVCEVRVPNNTTNFRRADMQLRLSGAGVPAYSVTCINPSSSYLSGPSEPWSGLLVTPVVEILPGYNTLRVDLTGGTGAGGSGDVDFGRFEVRRVG